MDEQTPQAPEQLFDYKDSHLGLGKGTLYESRLKQEQEKI
jgi:hypothetical protein